MAESLRQTLDRRRTQMEAQRTSFLPHWRELDEYLSPRSSRSLLTNRDLNKGQKANDKIINSVGLVALRTLKSGLMAGLTSPARPWFQAALPDRKLQETGAVKQWLFEVESNMRQVLSRSNFYNTLPTVYSSLGAYGTGTMHIEEDDDKVIRCYTFPVGSFSLSLDSAWRVDTLMRKIILTVRQVVDTFGLEQCSDKVKSSYKNGNLEDKIDVQHYIGPNTWRTDESMSAKDKPFASVYYEESGHGDKLLRESGYDEQPFMAPRWDVFGEDVYGYSPGMDALGDIKQLQREEARKAEAIDKLVRPPMLADASLKTDRTSILPDAVTYIPNLGMTPHAGFRPAYEIAPRINELMLDIQGIEQRIRTVFFADLMQMFATSDNNNMTAREVEERHQEKLLVLGPMMERMNSELLDLVFDRVFGIMLRRGLIPPPPPEVQGQALNPEYISIMAQAQKLIGTNSIEKFFGFVGNLAQFKPESLDKVNFDAAIEEYGGMHGVSPKVIISEDQVKATRAARAKAQQAQQMAEMMPAMNQGAQAAQTLADTDIGGTSALQRMLGAA